MKDNFGEKRGFEEREPAGRAMAIYIASNHPWNPTCRDKGSRIHRLVQFHHEAEYSHGTNIYMAMVTLLVLDPTAQLATMLFRWHIMPIKTAKEPLVGLFVEWYVFRYLLQLTVNHRPAASFRNGRSGRYLARPGDDLELELSMMVPSLVGMAISFGPANCPHPG